MNEPESAWDKPAATEQSAGPGALGSEERTSPGQDPLEDSRAGQPASGMQTTAGSARDAGDQPHAQLLGDEELQSLLVRWKDIQAQFVDEPREAVQDADALVTDLMQRLARMFASERDQIESSWAGGGDGSTEELRHGLRRYRSFFERLLAA